MKGRELPVVAPSVQHRHGVAGGASGHSFVSSVFDNHLQVITAQTATLANQRTEIDILRRRMDASVLLVRAIDGGWAVLSKAGGVAPHRRDRAFRPNEPLA